MWEATYTSLFLFILSYRFTSSYQCNYISSSLYRFNYTSCTSLPPTFTLHTLLFLINSRMCFHTFFNYASLHSSTTTGRESLSFFTARVTMSISTIRSEA